MPKLDYEDWNRALTEHYFVGDTAEAWPIAQFLVTPEELCAACPVATDDIEAATSSFVNAVKRRIADAGTSVVKAAEREIEASGWRPDRLDIEPPFVGLLLATCFAAAACTETMVNEGNFRRRLGELYNSSRSESFARLPELWTSLMTWLVNARSSGQRYRQLILPDPGHMTRIGYSVRLGFPPRVDQRRLVELLELQGLRGGEPRVIDVLPTVGSKLAGFSERFRDVFADFRQSYQQGGTGTHGHPFWAAVRSAVELPHTAATRKEEPLIRLLAEDIDGSRLAPFIASSRPIDPPAGVVIEELDGLRDLLGSPTWALAATDLTDDVDGYDALVRIVLQDGLADPRFSLVAARRAFADGLMLFRRIAAGLFEFATSPQGDEAYAALLNADLKEDFQWALGLADVPAEFREEGWHGWILCDRLTGSDLRRARFDQFDRLGRIESLKVALLPPRLRLSRGVRVDEGFLGIAGALPSVRFDDDADAVRADGREAGFDLTGTADGRWQIPPVNCPLAGPYDFTASLDSLPQARQQVSFVSEAGHPNYKWPDSKKWRAEGTTVASIPLGDVLGATLPPAKYEVGGALAVTDDESGTVTHMPLPEVEALQTVLSALGSRRSGVSEMEIVALFRQVLELNDDDLVWSTVRAWCEHGYLVRAIDLRWRGARYFPVRPRFVLFQRNGASTATLMGLAPPWLAFRIEDELGSSRRTPRVSESGLVPPPPMFQGVSVLEVGQCAERHGLDSGVSLAEVAAIRPVAMPDVGCPLNYELWGRWDWIQHRFRADDQMDASDSVSIERYGRNDAPEWYGVRSARNGSIVYWSRSRAWAMLEGYRRADLAPFFFKDAGKRLVTSVRRLHLPKVFSLLSAATSTRVGGPSFGDGQSYEYTYVLDSAEPSRDLLSRFDIGALVGSRAVANPPVSAGPRVTSAATSWDSTAEAFLREILEPALADGARQFMRNPSDLDGAPNCDVALVSPRTKLALHLSASPSSGESAPEWAHLDLSATSPEQSVSRLRRSVVADPFLHPVLSAPRLEPHGLQAEALQSLRSARERGVRRGLVVLATGTGKTLLSAFDAARHGGRILFVNHRNDILEQAMAAYASVMPDRTMGLYNSNEKRKNADVVFANIATLRLHLAEFSPTAFDYIVYDEFHHAATRHAARVIAYFSPRFFLGMTATPNRTDSRSILKLVDGNLLAQVTQSDAIEQGYLVPFEYRAFHDDIDYSGIKHNGFSYDIADLDRHLSIQARDDAIIRIFNDHVPGKRGIGFCVNIHHAERAAQRFSEAGIPSMAIHSRLSQPRRDARLRGFRNGDYQLAFVRDLFNEGVDFPDVETLLFMRPTQSHTVFTQQLGRGLRLSPGKRTVRVFDFIGNYLNAHRVLDYLSSYGNRVSMESVRSKPSIGFDIGCSVEFESRVVKTLGLIDKGVADRGTLVEHFFLLYRTHRRVPSLSELQADPRYSIRHYVAAFDGWSRFLERISSLDSTLDLEPLRPPSSFPELTQESLDDVVDSFGEGRGGLGEAVSESLLDVAEEFTELCNAARMAYSALIKGLAQLSEAVRAAIEELQEYSLILGFTHPEAAGGSPLEPEADDSLSKDRFFRRILKYANYRDTHGFVGSFAATVPLLRATSALIATGETSETSRDVAVLRASCLRLESRLRSLETDMRAILTELGEWAG